MGAALGFTVATAASALLTPRLRDLANQRGWLDHASSSRKVHRAPIPRIGGIAIVAAFFFALLVIYAFRPTAIARFGANPLQALGFLGGGIAIAALGVADDLKGMNARAKFAVQFGVAAAMYAVGYRIDSIALPLGVEVQLGWAALPFTMLWIAGVINAVNLIDGLDGLAGGVALIAVVTTCLITGGGANGLVLLFGATVAGAVLGFLFYNFNPASIFMGDTGSMFLGFVLATMAIPASQRPSTAVALFVPIVALGLPIADTLLAMGRRAARGAPLFSADRGHIHHRLLDLGLSHRQTVLVLYAVSIALGLGALGLVYASSSVALWLLLAVAGMAYLGLRRLGFIDLAQAEQLLDRRRRNLEMRAAIRRVGSGLRNARSVADVWDAVQAAASVLRAPAVALSAEPIAEPGDATLLAAGFDATGGKLFTAHFAVGPATARSDYIELGWTDGRARVDRDTEIAIELLCDQVAVALERLRGDDVPQAHVLPGAAVVRRSVGLRS